jgi:hypothetical protein
VLQGASQECTTACREIEQCGLAGAVEAIDIAEVSAYWANGRDGLDDRERAMAFACARLAHGEDVIFIATHLETELDRAAGSLLTKALAHRLER